MQISDIDSDFLNYTNTLGTVALRKLARELGLKGLSSARGESIRLAIREAYDAEQKRAAEEQAAIDAIRAAEAAPTKKVTIGGKKSTGCEDCGRKVNKSIHPELCPICYDYAGWENTHQDSDDLEGHETCPICHPELDKRNRREGRSRAGMEIVAKGTEVHKSNLFKAAAEAKGWTVEILVTPIGDDEEKRHMARATKDKQVIQLSWNGAAYDYAGSGAVLNGKGRKVRNLKEALRLI